MKQRLFTLLALVLFTISNAQNCIDFSLSTTYDFDILLVSKDKNDLGKATILVKVFDKWKQKKVQTITIESEFILKSKSFKACENNKTYATNTYLKSDENDFGDVIVADVNFDGKEDIAIKREEGGNGGPLYNFYLQSENQQFVLDPYLSNEMAYFPDYIDSKKKTLHINVRVDSATQEGVTYSYDGKSKTWSVAQKRTYRN